MSGVGVSAEGQPQAGVQSVTGSDADLLGNSAIEASTDQPGVDTGADVADVWTAPSAGAVRASYPYAGGHFPGLPPGFLGLQSLPGMASVPGMVPGVTRGILPDSLVHRMHGQAQIGPSDLSGIVDMSMATGMHLGLGSLARLQHSMQMPHIATPYNTPHSTPQNNLHSMQVQAMRAAMQAAQAQVQTQTRASESAGRARADRPSSGGSSKRAKQALPELKLSAAQLLICLRRHSGDKPFHCTTCGKDFAQKANLLRHMRTHAFEKPFSCTTCGKGFIYNSGLERHMRTHTGEKPFNCSVCSKDFSQRSHLSKHMRTHTVENELKCAVCGAEASDATKLAEHMRSHTGERGTPLLFRCPVCGSEFTLRTALLEHAKVHTNTHTLAQPPKTMPVQHHAPSEDALSTPLPEQVLRTSEPQTTSQTTSQTTTQTNSKTEPESQQTPGAQTGSHAPGPVPCPICGKAFAESDLAQHLHSHADQPATQSQQPSTDQQTHLTEKQFSCRSCGKTYQKNTDLIRHESTHANAFACDRCGQAFAHKTNLEDHLLICRRQLNSKPDSKLDSTVKPNKCEDESRCPFCGLRFGSTRALEAHVLSHWHTLGSQPHHAPPHLSGETGSRPVVTEPGRQAVQVEPEKGFDGQRTTCRDSGRDQSESDSDEGDEGDGHENG